MTYRPGRHIYLASGFFNEKQIDLVDFIELQEDTKNLPIYSPRIDGGVLKPDSPLNEIKMTFDSNKVSIEVADFVLAVIDDYDPGVIWEMGYAHAKGKSILGYSDVPGRKLNVMLAGCCNLGFVSGRDDLKRILQHHKQLPDGKEFPYNTWSGEIQ